MAIIIRNAKVVLLRATLLGYLEKKGHLNLRKKVRSIEE